MNKFWLPGLLDAFLYPFVDLTPRMSVENYTVRFLKGIVNIGFDQPNNNFEYFSI